MHKINVQNKRSRQKALSFKGQVQCRSMQVVMKFFRFSFLLKLKKIDPSCRFQEKRKNRLTRRTPIPKK